MKNSKTKPRQLVDELEAPIRLTPEQLETVAAGFAAQFPRGTASTGPTATTGLYPVKPVTNVYSAATDIKLR
jgi:hypothetical protein